MEQVPVVIEVTVLPETVHTDGVLEVNVTAPVPDPPLDESAARIPTDWSAGKTPKKFA